jgi:thiamine-monophosphate kinase
MTHHGPGEFERIRDIVATLPKGEGVVLGPGDDAAVLRPRVGRDLAVTTDAFVEGRHWRAELLDARAIGHRLAAANLSDLAAMAAIPRWALVSSGSPPDADAGQLRAIESAMASILATEGAAVVGGNLTATDGPAWISVTLIGDVARGGHWTRAGAQPGDVLAVTGHPGRAAATLALATWNDPPSFTHVPLGLAEAFMNPPCRVRAAHAMAAAGGVNAAIDLSDGLAGDLAHVCAASGTGALIHERPLPEDPMLVQGARAMAELLAGRAGEGAPPAIPELLERFRFAPGDDYELLLAIAPDRFDACADAAREAGTPLARIGEFTRDAGRLVYRRASGEELALPGRGFDHFG